MQIVTKHLNISEKDSFCTTKTKRNNNRQRLKKKIKKKKKKAGFTEGLYSNW